MPLEEMWLGRMQSGIGACHRGTNNFALGTCFPQRRERTQDTHTHTRANPTGRCAPRSCSHAREAPASSGATKATLTRPPKMACSFDREVRCYASTFRFVGVPCSRTSNPSRKCFMLIAVPSQHNLLNDIVLCMV